ncbi:phosphatase PAP2 family protein [Legionella maceachernii]|uniref:PAP2 superfamily protein n=2 Tax=Legionella TaxID=445 RepID=A0A0W0WGW5_9GAMM|nr:phosphatase PAP2 family protein [Legionella maceachernii]KTD31575.1 PAP2 superfamily protein [Legionella maceachernii]SKA11325.1 undecaprenyl-diphosphatase [Legionella maceachernii]SUO99600.1 PAP2 superfamily [Legionella maceachernii]
MQDQIAQFFLLFSDNIVIIPLLILGFIWLDRATFYHAVCLILLSILVNVALKVTFQIPLSPSLGKKGYAFPSGHMQLVTVLYTWLAFKIENLGFRVVAVALLMGIGLSLIHFDYHNYYDVLAGVFFALLLLISYYFSSLKWPKNVPWFILLIASLLMLYIHWRTDEILSHPWMAYYALWGLIIAEQIANRKAVAMVRSHKLLATLLCFVAILGVHTFFRYVITFNQPVPLYQLQWLLIGFIIPWANFGVAGWMKIKQKRAL